MAAIVLKRRSDAEIAGHSISSIVCASGSNHDGEKKGLTLPNGEAQAQLIRQTLKQAGLVPSDIHYFEVSSLPKLSTETFPEDGLGTWYRDESWRSHRSQSDRFRVCAKSRASSAGRIDQI